MLILKYIFLKKKIIKQEYLSFYMQLSPSQYLIAMIYIYI